MSISHRLKSHEHRNEAMSEEEPANRVKRLSDMEVGTLYHMTADDVDLFVQVVTPGTSPLCVVRGDMGKYLSVEDDSMLILQLVGWNPFNESMHEKGRLSYFVSDVQPSFANLLGLFYRTENPSGLEQIIVACMPTITPIS